MINKIIQGDCIEVMKTYPDNYFDSIVTDSPYDLTSMTKLRTDPIAVKGKDGTGNPYCRVQASGGNLVKNVEKSKVLITTMNEKLESVLGAKNVVSGTQLKIKLSEGKCVHPTVKPIALMRYLVRLVTPKGGIVLDPFIGSGTTAIACLKENFKFIGIEKEEEYIKIANARIKPYLEQSKVYGWCRE